MQATDKDLKSGTTLARTLELSSFLKMGQLRSEVGEGEWMPNTRCRLTSGDGW